MAAASPPATFEQFAKLGYTRLVPIVPHDAEISENSSLNKRQDQRGKAVGVRRQDGKWSGFDWLPYEADARDLANWQRMGAGIGIKTGKNLIGIDADTLDANSAAIINKALIRHFGLLPCRIGNYPKALFLARTTEPMRYTRVEFGELDDKGRLRDRVEILSDGRQFVAHGIHPKTLAPYKWTAPLIPLDQVPAFHPDKVLAFLEDIRANLPAAKPLITEGATTDINQASLRGDIDKVRKAVEATPNNSKHFATREAYRDYGYAIKAALPDNEPEALAIFQDWCARWEDGDNDPDVVEADWRRMKPPFRRGANFLYETAEQLNPTTFKKVDVFFDEIVEEKENIFAHTVIEAEREPLQPIKWIDPKEWDGAPTPIRRWIIAGMIPDGEVTLLTGAGGVGKTLLAQQACTSIALGKPFLGKETTPCKVMMFLCEDSEDELNLRQRSINAALGVTMDDISPVLRIASRKYMDNLLAIWDRNSGAMKRSAVWKQLRDDAVAFGAKLVVVDTIADTFGGSEIDRSQVRQFVQACLGKLAQEIGGAVLALGHPSKAGQAVGGDGTSGSTAWHATVRSRLYLAHATKDGSGPHRRLENRKANYGASGDVFMLRWARGAFDLVSAKVTAFDDDTGEKVAGGAGVGAAGGVPSMGNVIDDAVLEGVMEAGRQRLAMTDARNSPYWAPRVLHGLSDVLGVYPIEDVEAGWLRVLRSGAVAVAVVGRKPNRNAILGYKVVEQPDKVSVETLAGVFD